MVISVGVRRQLGREFSSVATRLPEEFRLSPDLAFELLESKVLPRMVSRRLSIDHLRTFLPTASGAGVSGARVYDAHIAEVARRNGAKTVLTGNRRHFTVLLRHGVRVLTATEFASEL